MVRNTPLILTEISHLHPYSRARLPSAVPTKRGSRSPTTSVRPTPINYLPAGQAPEHPDPILKQLPLQYHQHFKGPSRPSLCLVGCLAVSQASALPTWQHTSPVGQPKMSQTLAAKDPPGLGVIQFPLVGMHKSRVNSPTPPDSFRGQSLPTPTSGQPRSGSIRSRDPSCPFHLAEVLTHF